MDKNVKPIPEGYHAITPGLVIKDGARAIEFYKKAFNAKELYRMPAPDGSIMHAELQIGDSKFMIGTEMQDHPGHDKDCARSPLDAKTNTMSLYLYVQDCDTTVKNAVDAGAEAIGKMEDMFWGDRMGNLRDPFGYLWTVATHKVNVTPEQMKEKAKEFFAKTAVH